MRKLPNRYYDLTMMSVCQGGLEGLWGLLEDLSSAMMAKLERRERSK